ncbi:MAG: hypothetical protein WCH35_15350 [Comamonadaceae bacterium]
MLNLITPQSLKDLVDARAIRHATVVADKDVYKITVLCGTAERIVSVRARDGKTTERHFTSLDSVARFMREKVHLTQFDINVAGFEPQSKRVTRPDTALRMKGAHAALSHSDWLEKKVTAARAGLADGTNTRIVPQEWQSVRAAKQKQRDAQ